MLLPTGIVAKMRYRVMILARAEPIVEYVRDTGRGDKAIRGSRNGGEEKTGEDERRMRGG